MPYQLSGADLVQVPLKSGGIGLLLVGGYQQILLSGWGLGFSDAIFLLRDEKDGKDLNWEAQRSKLRTSRFEHAAQVIKKESFKCN